MKGLLGLIVEVATWEDPLAVTNKDIEDLNLLNSACEAEAIKQVA